MPGRDGKMADIVLGFDDLASYVATNTYFGATCGRYGNRIGHGRFEIDGKPVQVDCNEGPNHLHGGRNGFDRKLWNASPMNAAECRDIHHDLARRRGGLSRHRATLGDLPADG